LFGSISAAKH
jgi:hypothetical protein